MALSAEECRTLREIERGIGAGDPARSRRVALRRRVMLLGLLAGEAVAATGAVLGDGELVLVGVAVGGAAWIALRVPVPIRRRGG